jgi:hypothetical protein
MAEKHSSREIILEKIIYPTINALISSLIIGAVVSMLIDGKMERWKVISSLQIEREQQARVKTYDAYENASQEIANFYYRTGTTKQSMYDAIERFGDTVSAQAAYLPEKLEYTYHYLDYELIIGSRLLVKETGKPLSEAELARAGKSHAAAVDAEDALKAYMRSWHAGNLKKADQILDGYFQKYVKDGLEEADEYSDKILLPESSVKTQSAIE